MILLAVLFFGLLAFVLFCCLTANEDPDSRILSDREQMEFLAAWAKNHEHK